MSKGMSIDECVKNAETFIQNNGICLLLFDVKGSSNYDNPTDLINRLYDMMKDLNKKFGKYFPEHKLAVSFRKEKGFKFLLGDASWTGINSADVIPEIISYQKNKYPDIDLYWGVAIDGYDEERTKIAK